MEQRALKDRKPTYRANTLVVEPQEQWKHLCLVELLDAAAALVNVATYHRIQVHKQHANTHKTKRAITNGELRDRFQPVLGRAITDALIGKVRETWASFFDAYEKYKDPDNDEVTEKPGYPGFWKNDGKRILQTVARNDTYTIDWGEHSRIELALGKQLKDKYGLQKNKRLRVPIKGSPQWDGHQGRLELWYDRDADRFTARQPIKHTFTTLSTDLPTLLATDPSEGDEDSQGSVAAVDIGANTLVAVTTSNGHQRLYHGRPLFERYRTITNRIASLQSALDDDQESSQLIDSLYDRRTRQRNHAQDALARNLAIWLAARGVTDVYVGKLDDVLKTHWSAEVNEKTHLFWAHGRFRDRLADVCEEYGVRIHEESEAGTSSECPCCGEAEHVSRNGDVFLCGACGFEGHADLVGCENFLAKVIAEERIDVPLEFEVHAEAGAMARPAVYGQNSLLSGRIPRLEWDDHAWKPCDQWCLHGTETKEEPANRSTREGKFASTSAAGRRTHRGIPRL